MRLYPDEYWADIIFSIFRLSFFDKKKCRPSRSFQFKQTTAVFNIVDANRSFISFRTDVSHVLYLLRTNILLLYVITITFLPLFYQWSRKRFQYGFYAAVNIDWWENERNTKERPDGCPSNWKPTLSQNPIRNGQSVLGACTVLFHRVRGIHA